VASCLSAPRTVIELLLGFVKAGNHEFRADAVSIPGPHRINAAKIIGPRQITYLFLLALAVSHGGRLVTFDESIHIGLD